MDKTIEKTLGELVVRVMEHFNMDSETAIGAVCMSELANELSEKGNTQNLSIDQLCDRLYKEISYAI